MGRKIKKRITFMRKFDELENKFKKLRQQKTKWNFEIYKKIYLEGYLFILYSQ